MSSFLQTKEWMEFQKSLGREVFYIEQSGITARVVKHELRGRSYLYIPYGPEVAPNLPQGDLDSVFREFVTELTILAKKEKAIFVKAEPMLDSVAQFLSESGFKKTHKDVMPHRTVILDLTRTLEGILSSMHHKTRYNIKVAEGHSLQFQESRDIVSFLKLIRHTSDKKNFNIHPQWYYQKLLDFFPASESSSNLEVKLFLTYEDENPVAGAIVMLDYKQNTGYYLHGASDYHYRSLMAPHLLHWGIIKKLKELEFTKYDFWGIEAKKWPGVTRFKLGWGGRQVEYPGSFDLPTSNFWYLVYQIYRLFK